MSQAGERMSPGQFEAYRGLAFSIAYRMLGNTADAEDIVQECFLRLQRSETEAVGSPRNYLATIAVRLCLDQLKSARVRRERELDALPEPVPSGLVSEPKDAIELAESLSFAFLVMLERLSPHERSVFLLREVFEFEFDEIASVLGRSPAACRQLLRRARRHISDGHPRFRPHPEEAAALAARFAHACQAGDMNALLALLARDVTLRADGGQARTAYGTVRTLARPLCGAQSVARFLLAAQAQAPDSGASIEEVNGMPAIVARIRARAIGVLCFVVLDGRIQSIFIVNDPAKLRHFHAQ
jgi:RNA polymerase sigma-70 factor (ECF subfamily)